MDLIHITHLTKELIGRTVYTGHHSRGLTPPTCMIEHMTATITMVAITVNHIEPMDTILNGSLLTQDILCPYKTSHTHLMVIHPIKWFGMAQSKPGL